MRLVGCADCYLRLLGRKGDPLVSPWGREGYRTRFRDGLEFWSLDGFGLSADLDPDRDLDPCKLVCDVCCTVELGPRFGIVAHDMLRMNERART